MGIISPATKSEVHTKRYIQQ